MTKDINFNDIKNQWMKDPKFKSIYEGLELEFQLALELVKARAAAGLSQTEVASRMGTTQSVIARLESGKTLPSIRTLYKYAEAIGNHLKVSFHS